MKQKDPQLPVVMMTAFGTVEKAVEAMKKGAFDYISKPFDNESLKKTVAKALKHVAGHQREPFSFPGIKG